MVIYHLQQIELLILITMDGTIIDINNETLNLLNNNRI